LLRSVKYGLYGAVLAGVVGGTAAWHTVDKTVALVVDGQSTKVHTTAGRVGDILTDAGYHAGPHDIVAPALDASVHDGGRIVYQRGRLLHLDVNGVRKDVWTTAPTVADAMRQLGYSTADFTSVSRDKRLPLGATDLTVRTPTLVTIVHDGKTQRVTTTDATVGQLLADLGIRLGPKDRLSAPVSSALTANQKLVLGRVATRRVTEARVLPFPVKKVPTATLPAGQTQIVTAGRTGLAQVTYALVYLDGKLVGKTPIKDVVVRAPTAQVVHVGTQTAPAQIPTPGSAQAIGRSLAAARGWGDDQFNCLVQLWDHESGWRVNASNPSGAYGIPQALPGSKMATVGPNWQTDAATQITWGLGYIASRYGTPCGAWSTWQAQGGWY
jgi:resuscitation-promoting factor RpfB